MAAIPCMVEDNPIFYNYLLADWRWLWPF